MNHFIIKVNASALKMLQCPQKYKYRVIDGLVKAVENPILTIGKGVHKFVELHIKGMIKLQAIAHAQSQFNVTEFPGFYDLCMGYRKESLDVPLERAGEKFVEHYTAHHWKDIIIGEECYEIWVVGTLDKVAFKNGLVKITDIKTSRIYDEQRVFDTYWHSVQFFMYQWMLETWADDIFICEPEAAAAARAGKITTEIHLAKINTKTWAFGPPRSHTKASLIQFEQVLDTTVKHLAEWHHNKLEARRYGIMNDACTQCDYTMLCHSPEQEAARLLLTMYKNVPYEPQHF